MSNMEVYHCTQCGRLSPTALTNRLHHCPQCNAGMLSMRGVKVPPHIAEFVQENTSVEFPKPTADERIVQRHRRWKQKIGPIRSGRE